MFITHRSRPFLYLKPITFPPSSNPYPLFHRYSFLPFCTHTSDYSPTFPVSYLINTLGFSPQSASKLSSTYHLGFKTAKKPDAVLSFFRNRGFSNSQLHNMIVKAPWLLSCDPYKRVLPKFLFLQSKGASTSHIVNLASNNPHYVLAPSLNNQIVPTYELVYKYLKSDKDIIALLNYRPTLLGERNVSHNINLLIENGVTDSAIVTLLRSGTRVLNTEKPHMLKVVQELKDLGFHPSTAAFSKALLAKTIIPKTRWKKKVDAFKNWGWSDEDVLDVFKKRPQCMLKSVDKINLLMSFWVNQLGWDALALVKGPIVFSYGLERRIIPRAAVVQFLLKKGLIKKNASLISPFKMTDKVFVDKFMKQFMEDSSDLLKLYKEKMNLPYTTVPTIPYEGSSFRL